MLKLRRVGIDTLRENVAFLARTCREYRPEEFQALDKIEVKHDGRALLATLNIVDDTRIVGPDELGLSPQAFADFAAPDGALVAIEHAVPPRSLDAVRAKIGGARLSEPEIVSIVKDIAAHRYSKMEIAAFLAASAGLMTEDEIFALTLAMAGAGTRLDWKNGPIVDKHSIGGIPGNRTSMIVVPIVAAHGLIIPKTSSRAITSPAGTADTMEVLARVDLSVEEMRAVVEREHGCLVWGGHVNLSPADDVLISVERPLAIDTREQMVASILSKKLAAGSTHLVIDVPLGPTAKVRSRADALGLKRLFGRIAARIGLVVDVVVTDGSAPVGRGVGPALEARDVMQVLRGDAAAPADLRDKALALAARVLAFDPALGPVRAKRRAGELLRSGAAASAMERIVAAQGAAAVAPELGSLTREVTAPRQGRVAAVDCYRIARIARLAGAPLDKGAGVDLLVRPGDRVALRQPLYRIHARHPSDFRFATEMAGEDPGVAIAS
jgi:thymidine phosphorylase